MYGGLARDGGGGASHDGVPCELRGGSFVDDPGELEAAARLWAPVGGRARPPGAIVYAPQPCLRLAQWAKLAWNAPFNGFTVAAGGTDVGAVWRDPAGRAACVAIMREILRAANADLAAAGAAPRLDEDATVAELSKITDAMAAKSYVPSTTKDFIAGNRMEIASIFEEPLRRATALGVDAPALSQLAALLGLLNAPKPHPR